MNIQQARQLAQDETAQPKKLRELDLSDLIVRKNIVLNPNIPPDVLKKLAPEFPKEVFENPAIDLLLLETPDLFSGTVANIWCNILKYELSTKMLQYAVKSTDDRLKLAILMNPQTPLKILEQLAQSKNPEISEAAKTHINYLPSVDVNYEKFAQEKIDKTLEPADKYLEFEIAFNKVRSYHTFFSGIYEATGMAVDTFCRKNAEALAKKSSYKRLYKPPVLSDEDLKKLDNLRCQDFCQDVDFIYKMAANPNTPVKYLKKIAELDKYGKTYSYLAANYNVSPDIIEKLLVKLAIDNKKPNRTAQHEGDDRRTYNKIISNPAAPFEILEKIAHHQSNKVRAIAANNSEMPQSLVKRILSSFEDTNFNLKSIEYEYRNLIKHPMLSDKLIDKLISFLEDKIKSLEKIDSKEFYYEPKAYYEFYAQKIRILARHPNINSTTLTKLLKHKDKLIAASAFKNKKIPQYIADEWGLQFLDTLNYGQLQTIAKNIYTPDIILEKLLQYDNKRYYVVQDVLRNPRISERTLQIWEKSPLYNSRMIMGIRDSQQQFLDLWKSLLSDCNRLTILEDTRTPIPLLAKVSASTSWLERYAIAKNLNTPQPIIQRLAEDANRIVRAAAKSQLEMKEEGSIVARKNQPLN